MYRPLQILLLQYPLGSRVKHIRAEGDHAAAAGVDSERGGASNSSSESKPRTTANPHSVTNRTEPLVTLPTGIGRSSPVPARKITVTSAATVSPAKTVTAAAAQTVAEAESEQVARVEVLVFDPTIEVRKSNRRRRKV